MKFCSNTYHGFSLSLAQTDREVVAATTPQIAYILMFVAIAVASLIITRNLLRSKTTPLMRVVWIGALVSIVIIAIVLLVN